MRERRRYVAFEVMKKTNTSSARQAINSFQSELSKSKQLRLKLVLYDERSQRGLLRCGHKQLGEIKTAMSGTGGTFKILGVSGTIRAAKRKFLAGG